VKLIYRDFTLPTRSHTEDELSKDSGVGRGAVVTQTESQEGRVTAPFTMGAISVFFKIFNDWLRGS